MAIIDSEELEHAFHWVSAGVPFENRAFVSRSTGRIYWIGDGAAEEGDLPEDIEDVTLYVAVPHRNDFNLGKTLALRFVEERLPSALSEAQAAFRHSGAYRRFKQILDRAGLIDAWHLYEGHATAKALKEWAAEQGLSLSQMEVKEVGMDRKNQPRAEGQEPRPQPGQISHLRRREIQAPIAAGLIRGFARVMGQDKALEIATAAVQADAVTAGRIMAEKYGGNSMKELGRIVRDVWAEADAMTIHILEETEQRFHFDVTRCRYAEFYAKAEMKELGFCLSCCRDEAFTRGFNPRMKLLRSQTIMQGSPLCDFRFFLE